MRVRDAIDMWLQPLHEAHARLFDLQVHICMQLYFLSSSHQTPNLKPQTPTPKPQTSNPHPHQASPEVLASCRTFAEACKLRPPPVTLNFKPESSHPNPHTLNHDLLDSRPARGHGCCQETEAHCGAQQHIARSPCWCNAQTQSIIRQTSNIKRQTSNVKHHNVTPWGSRLPQRACPFQS